MGDADKAASKPDAEEQSIASRTRSQRSPSPASSQIPKRIKTTSLVSAPSSVGESPKTSREASPSRNGFKLQSNTSRLSRSRKNSQELNRGNAFSIPDTPSPAAIQRALAAAGPAKQSSLTTLDDPKSQKSSRAPSATRSVRLTSPPPVSNNNRRDLDPPLTPSIIVNQATPKSATSFENIEEEGEEQLLTPDMRSPRSVITASRLEAVLESVDPETPALASGSKPFFTEALGRSETIPEASKDKSSILSLESGNESAGGMSIASNATVENKAARPVLHPRNSHSQMTITKSKNPSDSTIRNMTVETETVMSVPSMNVGAPADARNTSGKQDPNSTLRMKPSTETMRPRKEKKKTIRKAPSLASTTGTSKADIFEAKVKSTIEQADSSDSEETFVYESNPPEPAPPRSHSRTPSMTSIASHGDYYRGRYRQDAGSSLAGKKSMKFANNTKNVSNYPSAEDTSSIDQTLMNAIANPATGSAQFPRHIGRHGRHPAHLSLFDNEAPFNNNPRSPRKATAGSFTRRASPRPHTPRSANFRVPATGKSYGTHYDLEADDERTPLISSVRSVRSRRRGYDPREEDYNSLRPRSSLKRIGACMCFGSLFTLLVALVVASLILCSRPLQNVRLKAIENVLASDKQIIFDLRVQAVNPNIVGVQITDMNLYVHARSSYVGDSKWWREHGGDNNSTEDEFDAQGGVDEGTDPIFDDPHLMLVGQVSSFDVPLSFGSSPWHHSQSTSVGAVRLDRPSNSSESEKDRWEMVFYHDFDLIVRGVLQYTLPISSRVRAAEISGKTLVKPSILPEPIQDPPEHEPEPKPKPEPDEPKKGNGTSSDRAHINNNTHLKKTQRISIRPGKISTA